jgi:2',3'-cyclic-nucleotide 2'-phosphodiesterase (5'-nucleotidase family)
MGGLSRKSNYIKSLRERGIDPVIIDAGEALFSSPFIAKSVVNSERYKAEAFLSEFENIGCDAINIGGIDLAGGYEFLKELSQKSSVTFLSANLKEVDTGIYPFEPYKIINRNGLLIGVIGVTNLLPVSIDQLEADDFIQAGKKYISKIKKEADIVVILVNAERNQEDLILEEFTEADYVIQSRPLSRTSPGRKQKKQKPILFKMGKEAKFLTVININYNDPFKDIVDVTYPKYRNSFLNRQLNQYQARDPEKNLDSLYSNQPTLLRQIRKYVNERDSLENFINQAVNISEYSNAAMHSRMAYDTTMQTRIDQYLETADSLRTAELMYSRYAE